MPNEDLSANSPRIDDTLSSSPQPMSPAWRSPAGVLIQNVIRSMNAAGADAEASYKAAIAEARKKGADVAAAAAQLYGTCSRHDYPLRWALVYMVSRLGHRAAIPFLKNVVSAELPSRSNKAMHGRSDLSRELVIRTTAVEGVAAFADVSKKQAQDALFEFLEIDSISIRRAAVQSLLAIDGRSRSRISDCLPKSARFLLDLKHKDVNEVRQVKRPQKHLRRGRTKKPSPPSIEEGQPAATGKGPRTEN